MKKMLFISILSLLLASTNVSAVENAAPEAKVEIQSQSNVLKGMVFDKSTNETLAGAIITANGNKVYTDLDGNFAISNVCGDKCQLKISLISYKDQTLEIDTRNTHNVQIKLQQH